jgi:hypothetical protein
MFLIGERDKSGAADDAFAAYTERIAEEPTYTA